MTRRRRVLFLNPSEQSRSTASVCTFCCYLIKAAPFSSPWLQPQEPPSYTTDTSLNVENNPKCKWNRYFHVQLRLCELPSWSANRNISLKQHKRSKLTACACGPRLVWDLHLHYPAHFGIIWSKYWCSIEILLNQRAWRWFAVCGAAAVRVFEGWEWFMVISEPGRF